MFCDIKDQLDNPTVRTIMAASAYDPSPQAMEQKAVEFRRHESWQIYGWVENDEIVHFRVDCNRITTTGGFTYHKTWDVQISFE
jgi:hypothetical protein